MDGGLERVVALGFRERLAVERHGVLRARPGRRPDVPGRSRARCPAQPLRAPARAGRSRGRCHRRGRACRRRGADAVARRPDVAGGREPKRLLGQLGGRRRRAAGVRRSRGVLEDRGDLARRLGRGEREVPRSFLGGRDDLASRACSDRRREGVWRAATADPSSGWVKRRRSPSSSRIRAASASARPGIEAATDGGFHERDGRIGERRDTRARPRAPLR